MQWRIHKMETIRELIIEHGASIKFVEGICTIRINENYPFKTELKRVLRDLKSLILGKNYIFNYLKFL